jgi:hypothetical protein
MTRYRVRAHLNCIAVLVSLSLNACSIHMHPSNANFDKIAGKGPLTLISSDETQPSRQFFVEHLGDSESLRQLVSERGMPEAISVEREFLHATLLKLFYPKDGRMYVCTRQEGHWMVLGAEPISASDIEKLNKQRIVTPTIAHTRSNTQIGRHG